VKGVGNENKTPVRSCVNAYPTILS